MKRLAVIFLLLAMFACGGSDTGEPGATEEGAPGGEMARMPDTPKPAAEVAPEGKTPRASAVAQPSPETVERNVENCLGLVGKGRFEQAVRLCTATLKMDPGNREVREALDEAREQAAKAASRSAGRTAGGQADSKLGEAAGGIAGGSDD